MLLTSVGSERAQTARGGFFNRPIKEGLIESYDARNRTELRIRVGTDSTACTVDLQYKRGVD